MFRKILVCSDLSAASDALVHCVEELKSIGMKEIVLAHAIPYADFPLTEEGWRTVDRQVKMLAEQGVRVVVDIPAGPAGQILAETAEVQDVSAILIGSHGKGILKAAALGSVSSDVIHHARRTVLLARIELLEGGKCRAVCGRLFDKVLFPTDFSETAERALDYVGLIARQAAVPVTVLHVVEPKTKDAAEERRAEEAAQYLLEMKKRRLESAGAVEVTTMLAKGDPRKEVVAIASRGDFSVVVMGFKGKGVLEEAFLGSVATEAARHAGVPVLFIPTPV